MLKMHKVTISCNKVTLDQFNQFHRVNFFFKLRVFIAKFVKLNYSDFYPWSNFVQHPQNSTTYIFLKALSNQNRKYFIILKDLYGACGFIKIYQLYLYSYSLT